MTDTDNAPRRKLSILVPELPWEKDTPENLLVMQEKPDPDWYEQPNRMNEYLIEDE